MLSNYIFLIVVSLGAMADAPASQMLVGNNIFKEFKGAFTGQLQDWMENIPLYGLYKYFREK